MNTTPGNQRGGKRPGAGRPKGSANVKTREIADTAAAEGLTPLEFMLQVMRDVEADFPQRLDMAKAAAPYIHPRLSSIAATVEADVNATITHIERRIVDPSN